jgi:hypothetical protein
MSQQKHDIGNKKRRAAEAQTNTPKQPTSDSLAMNLVTRGLASTMILDRRTPAERQP